MNKPLKTYTFQGYRWIPSYKDFDFDDVDVEASNVSEAFEKVHAKYKNWKTIDLTHVNGGKVRKLGEGIYAHID